MRSKRERELCDRIAALEHQRNCYGVRIKELESQITALRRDHEIVEVLNALRENEGEAVHIPNPNPDFGGPAQVITVYRDFDDDDGTAFTSGPEFQGMDESLLDCLRKAVVARVNRG